MTSFISFLGLHAEEILCYSIFTVAKSTVGRENPSNSVVTPDAPCVFFCVYALVHLILGRQIFICYPYRVMVARAGQPSGWPVSIEAGFSPPFGPSPKRENFSDGNNRYSLEIVAMANPSVLSHPNFIFVFAAIRRIDTQARVCMLRITACDERSARMQLVREYVLSLAARLPVSGGVA
ncbi:Ash protein family protein [Rosenbergiella nectarea]|uniref:Ash protein family protein n=1 Tax=Rosenbergiella nectarea TaxID=988801 RepID=A0A1H9JH74_9GAMM|nr:host cell division inhibitor Icd-like protein [Rosenbergiella nectarea]SEQ86264.1 Ash protein family protein [Rosenbergiella nectarea]